MEEPIAILHVLRRGVAPVLLVAGFMAPVLARAANPSAAAAPDAGQLAQAITAVRDISTMRADFTQTDANGQRVSGVLTIKRPKKFRFQYQPDYPMLIVSDGRALVMIDYQVRQVQRWPLRYTPVGALLDPGRNVSHIARLGPGEDPGSVTVLIHDRGHRENGDMTLLFLRNKAAPGGLELVAWSTVDAQNQRTIVRLSHQQYGIEVPDDTFTWIDPRRSKGKPSKSG